MSVAVLGAVELVIPRSRLAAACGLASIYMHEYGSDNLVQGGSSIDLVIR